MKVFWQCISKFRFYTSVFIKHFWHVFGSIQNSGLLFFSTLNVSLHCLWPFVCLLRSWSSFNHPFPICILSFSSAGSRWGIPLVTKVMRKEARHTQRRDRASGVPPDILEYFPPKNQSLPTLLLCALTSDFTGGCRLPPSLSLCQRVNLQLQLIKFLGN